MRSRIIPTIMALTVVLALSSVAVRQAAGQGNAAIGGRTSQSGNDSITLPSIPPPEGWLSCPRCQNNDDRAKAWADYEVDGHPFDPRDLTGLWGWGPDNTVADAFNDDNVPALTEFGEQQRQATFAEEGRPLRSKDTSGRGSGSAINCDPYAWPRLYAYNFGFEFVMLPNRVLQFFELGHTWRTIWTDGRELPEFPPELRWLGWSVGRWEGDTFVIESNGFDDRSWINASSPDGGWTHSDEMRVVERYTRIDYGTMEGELTIIDPRTYTQPWVTPKSTMKLNPGTELYENFCAPSDYQQFNERVFNPAAAEVGNQ